MSENRGFRFSGQNALFDRFACAVTRLAGSSGAFALAVGVIIGWASTGPWLDYSETWQLVINTGTTIVTFLMVFLIQQSQNKDSKAIHIKLNELIASNKLASNQTISIEDLDEAALEKLHRFYCRLADLAEKDGNPKSSHSLDDADAFADDKPPRSKPLDDAVENPV